MFWKKKKEDKKVTKPYYEFIVWIKGMDKPFKVKYYLIDRGKNTTTIPKFIQKFTQWLYCRNTPFYTLHYSDGAFVFNRSEISIISIEKGEE